MKTMLVSDLMIAKKFLLSQMAFGLLVAVALSWFMGNFYVALSFVTALLPFSLAFMLAAIDDRGGWQSLRLTLPLCRRDVVCGRYATVLLFTASGMVLGLLSAGVAGALSYAVPSNAFSETGAGDGGWQLIVLICVGAAAMMLIILSVLLPLTLRFGMTKAVRFIPMLFFVFIPLGYLAKVSGLTSQPLVAGFLAWTATPTGTLGLAAILAVGSLALFAASGAAALRLYAKREL